jgi:hypothetical protein
MFLSTVGQRESGLLKQRGCPERNRQIPAPQIWGKHSTFYFTVCGMGGLGKTQVAIKWMVSRIHHFDAVFWLGTDQKSIFAQSLARLAVDLGLEEQSGNLTQSCNPVLDWPSNPARSLDSPTGDEPELQGKAKWLIILDNAHDPKVLDDFALDKGCGSILITSRDPQAKKYFRSSPNGCDLQPLSVGEGAKLMERLTKDQEPFSQNDSLNQVSELLGGLQLEVGLIALVIPPTYPCLRGFNAINGFSAVGGQTNSAYIIGGLAKDEAPMGHTVSFSAIWQQLNRTF